MSAEAVYSPGLEGIIAGETAISTVEGGLRYRGYAVTELAEQCSFDEVAYLLLYNELPSAKQLQQFQARVAAARRIPAPLRELFQALPKWTPPMDALRTSISILAHFDQDAPDTDLPSGVVGAIGALKGRLHGGANEKVMDILLAAGGPETAEAWIRDMLAKKEKIMGFGHRVYKAGDVRAKVLREYARKSAASTGNTKWEETAEIIERVMQAEKNLLPNLDWPAGRLYHALGLEIPIYTPIFVMSRITGWAAHVIEQLGKNRLIRPRARYTGPELRPVTPLAERG